MLVDAPEGPLKNDLGPAPHLTLLLSDHQPYLLVLDPSCHACPYEDGLMRQCVS